MNALYSEYINLLKLVAGDPSSTIEIASIWGLVFVSHTIAVIITGKSVQSSMAYSVPRAMIITLLSVSTLILALACSNLYIMPNIGNSSLRGIVPAMVLILTIAGNAGLACTCIHKTRYSKAIATILISVACAVGMAYITKEAFSGIRNAKASAIQMRNKTEEASKVVK
jgi:hypothetical protein